ncbi:hypothetical protein BV898_06535 [Hypsibius exemplaris]|uniref:Cytokine-like nuclear factor N-PAC n=1 Tax=Hypsibius exemplaris TaxID=2072580 RepID=A0A1W0WW27_HYPEX|nr:hypothetical protein BV898_06535 [Hypsibius exemplaris]
MAGFRVGEVVWARMKGYPFWPGTVQDPTNVAEHKASKKKNSYYVKFFDSAGKNQFAWIGMDELKEFQPNLEKLRLDADKRTGKMYNDLKKSIVLAEAVNEQFQAALASDPTLKLEYGLTPEVEGAASESTQIVDAAKTPAKKTPGKKKTAGVKTPGEVEPTSTSAAAVKRLKILPMPAKSEEDGAKASGKGGRTPVGKKSTAAAASKKRVVAEDDDFSPARIVNGNGVKKLKSSIMTVSGKKDASAASAGGVLGNGKSQVKKSFAPPRPSHPQPPQKVGLVSLGLIGLGDPRTVLVARHLLGKGVAVRVWSKDRFSRDLISANAGSITDAEKVFEEADVVFLSATSGQELRAILGGSDHVLRKIRPTATGGMKGVCVFSSVSKSESEELRRSFKAKNICYLDCAWINLKEHGNERQLSVVASGDRHLYDYCVPLFQSICQQSTFLAEDVGLAQVFKAAVAMAEGIALAGLTEAAYFAQRNGLELEVFGPTFQAAFTSPATLSKVQEMLDCGSTGKESTAVANFKYHYAGLRDALHLAHPSAGPSSVTSLSTVALDVYQTHFSTYRYEREHEHQPPLEKMEESDDDEVVSGDDVPVGGGEETVEETIQPSSSNGVAHRSAAEDEPESNSSVKEAAAGSDAVKGSGDADGGGGGETSYAEGEEEEESFSEPDTSRSRSQGDVSAEGDELNTSA